jgi:hypothetical protein
MENSKKTFSLEEVEKLIKYTYEVGFCDGESTCEFRDYINADDFWGKNIKRWLEDEIMH